MSGRRYHRHHGGTVHASRRRPSSATEHIGEFLLAYVEAALWSSNDNADESGGEPLDKNYGPDDIAPDTVEAMQADCEDFLQRYGHLLTDDDSPQIQKHGRWEVAGHDYWLTRQGHGSGFWDGGWPRHGDELSEAAKSYGEVYLIVGDDGKIHQEPLTPRRKRANEVDERDPRTGRFVPDRSKQRVHPGCIDRRRLGEMMSPWGGDSGSGLPIYAVGSFYFGGKAYPDRSMVERAIAEVERMVPLANQGQHGWTRKDASELRTIARGLKCYLALDYTRTNEVDERDPRTGRSVSGKPDPNPLSGPRKEGRDRAIESAVASSRRSKEDYAVWMDARGAFHTDKASTANWRDVVAVAHAPSGHLSYKSHGVEQDSGRNEVDERDPRTGQFVPARHGADLVEGRFRSLASGQLVFVRSVVDRHVYFRTIPGGANGDMPLASFLRQYEAEGGHGTSEAPSHGHRVNDFDNLEALVEHERDNGATHVLALGQNTIIYYPTGRYWSTNQPQYESAKAYENSGYWHVTAKRTPLTGPLHGGAQTIEAFLGRHTAEAAPRSVVAPRHRRSGLYAQASRRGRQAPVTAVAVATELSRRAKGSTPKTIPGGHRWSEPNESATFVTYSPDRGQTVVVLVSVFPKDHSLTLDFFSDESLSEMARYENVANFLYRTPDYGEMMADLKWVWETVDGYAASWDEGDGEMDEAAREQPPAAPDPAGEWAVVQRMVKVYAEKAGLGAYVHNSAVPTGRAGVWKFWAQKPGERAKEHEVTTQKLQSAYGRGGLSERAPATSVRDYDVTDNRGRRLAGPFKDYGQARTEADKRGGLVGFVAGERHLAAPPRHRRPGGLHAEASRRRFTGGETTIKLTRAQTKDYEDHGPVGDDTRRAAKRAALDKANRIGRSVTIYSNDGITFEQIHPDDEFVREHHAGHHAEASRRRETPRHRHRHSVLSRRGSRMLAESKPSEPDVDAEGAGETYAEDQLNGDYFRDWMWDQMTEGRRMRNADPKSVIPLDDAADYKRLARNMLQQLEWDMARDMNIRDVLAVVGVESEGGAHDSAVGRGFFKGVWNVLHKPAVVNRVAKEARSMETTLKNHERQLRRGRGRARKTSEPAALPAPTPRKLLPPAPTQVHASRRHRPKWNQQQQGNAWVTDGQEGFWATFPKGTSAKEVLDSYMDTADYSGATGTFTVRAEIDGDVASVRVGPGGEIL